jgi:hypothetical protein
MNIMNAPDGKRTVNVKPLASSGEKKKHASFLDTASQVNIQLGSNLITNLSRRVRRIRTPNHPRNPIKKTVIQTNKFILQFLCRTQLLVSTVLQPFFNHSKHRHTRR